MQCIWVATFFYNPTYSKPILEISQKSYRKTTTSEIKQMKKSSVWDFEAVHNNGFIVWSILI